MKVNLFKQSVYNIVLYKIMQKTMPIEFRVQGLKCESTENQ